MNISRESVCGVHSRRLFLRGTATAGLVLASGKWTIAADKVPVVLNWPDVPLLVEKTLAARSGYRPGDLIVKSEVATIFARLAQHGWKVADSDKILALVLDDNSFLARELLSTAGLKFARGVAKEPLVFDRLDRLSRMPGGEQLVHDLIRLPNGQKLMSKQPTAGFTDLTILLPKQASGKTPTDKDFNKPTGKIYTSAALVTVLEQIWLARK